ncbi:hypothetical protein [Dietzia sp. CQ4]|uniref:hypothetical protein n=1 Tax=Dietzia sp. (strain CQ4) TaxID=370437 RepID=UPI0015F9FDC9|nr:hypothetical protein [Dietzia sp. CQ4]
MTETCSTTYDVDAEFAALIEREFPKLTGRQTPESMAFTTGGDLTHGQRAAKLAARLKWKLMPWQLWSLERILAKTDGRWTHPEACLLVPRQNGKSLILVFRVIYGLFVLGENIIFSAHQWETAKALWQRMNMILKDVPSLRARLAPQGGATCSQGRGVFMLRNGAKAVFTTRSQHAGRGLDRVDLLIYDEAYDLTEADMAALSPTKMAADDPQTIYTSSAVNAHAHSNGDVLTGVRRRGRLGELGLFYGEWCARPGSDRTAPTVWREANPSYGIIQTDRKISAELRSAVTDAAKIVFDVEYLGMGVWPDELGEVEPPVNLAAWDDLIDLEASPAGQSCIAVECEPSRGGAGRVWSIGAAVDTETGTHLQLGVHEVLSPAQVVERVKRIVKANDPVAVVLDSKSVARDLIGARLLKADIEPEFVTAPLVSATTNGFLQAVDDEAITHDGNAEVRAGLEAAQLREIGESGGVAWSRKAGGQTSHLIVLSYALWGLGRFRPEPAEPVKKTTVRAVKSRAAGSSWNKLAF